MKDKLIELMTAFYCVDPGYYGVDAPGLADHLIANGVTIPVSCEECIQGSHIDCPEGRVWCEKMCRYMVFEGYCSYGKKRCEDG